MSVTPGDPAASAEPGLAGYGSGATSFVVGLLPSEAMRLSVAETLRILRARLGDVLDLALADAAALPATARPDGARPVPAGLAGPVAAEPDGRWLARENVVGVNIRTVGDVWGVVRYVLTVPAIQRGIHLLPHFEPGVVGSLYGPASWHVDPAIASAELRAEVPGLDTADRQLRAVVHVLHALGRTVGMDVVPHTDRFSEIVLAQPDHFEWLERAGDRIARFGDPVVPDVERGIHGWLRANGPAVGELPATADELFRGRTEAERTALLFGPDDDPEGRRARRLRLVRDLHPTGFETVPATMAPPYRGLEVDPSGGEIVDASGLTWRDYRITAPEPMSRVFGPLARYHLYASDGPGGWGLDFDRPNRAVWAYVAGHYADHRDRFGFDFMRGDMAHVQMRPDGVPAEPDDTYDVLSAVRDEVRERRGFRPFGYLAETFLAPPGTMGYGDEADHLEAARADATLGDLQSLAVDAEAFLPRLRRYRDLLATRTFAPSFTVMTADKDDPRFDGFYLDGNEVRLFMALFLPDMPSYMGLGYELRDRHPRPAPNEHYTKLFVIELPTGPNARTGAYRWGENRRLFAGVDRIRRLAEAVLPPLGETRVTFLRPPDATGADHVIAWVVEGAGEPLLAVANLGANPAPAMRLPATALGVTEPWPWLPLFSTAGSPGAEPLVRSGGSWTSPALGAWEGRLYRRGTGGPD